MTAPTEDRKMLITGASSGVGLSLVRHFARSFHVIAVARRGGVLEREFGTNKSVTTLAVDLARHEELAHLCTVIRNEAALTHMINNAGVNVRGAIETLEAANLERSLQVNALAPLALMQAALPTMQAVNYGRIINVTSGAPLNSFPGFAAYSGSKALLNVITVTAAKEHADQNIKINLMSPGPVRSQMSPDSDIDPEVCHPTADYLVGLDRDGPTGKFFWLGHEVPLVPDLTGVDWLSGDAGGVLRRIL